MTTEPVILGADDTIAMALASIRRAELPPALASMVFVVRASAGDADEQVPRRRALPATAARAAARGRQVGAGRRDRVAHPRRVGRPGDAPAGGVAAYIYQGQELGLPEVDVPVDARVDPSWARGGITRDGARVPLPWTRGCGEPGHGFSLGSAAGPAATQAAAPWLPQPAGWGRHAVETQQQDPGSTLALVTAAVGLRRKLRENGVFTADDGGSWRVEAGNLLICERSPKFLVAVAMGSEPVRLPAGTVLASAVPLEADGWLQPDNAAWVLGGGGSGSRGGGGQPCLAAQSATRCALSSSERSSTRVMMDQRTP